MDRLLFDSLLYFVATCHAVSLIYLFFANYIRVRYPEHRVPAARASTLVAAPWLLYAVIFVPLRVTCRAASTVFVEQIACVLDYIWLFYLALGLFLICFAWATGICWHLVRALHRHSVPRPAH